MIIKSVTLHNYRGFDDVTLHLNPNFNVIIGKNGAGKTTALDAIATMLGTWFQGSKIPVHGGNIKPQDCRFEFREIGGEVFREVEDEVYLEAKCLVSDQTIEWRRDFGDRGRKARDFIKHGSDMRAAVKKDHRTSLPVLLYYGSGRLWNTHRNIETSGPKSIIEAYKFCLDPLSDQKTFERWFKRMTQSSIQKRSEFPSLDVVERSIIACIPGAKRFYFDIELDETVVELEEEGLVPFNSLSDGFRNMVAMIADIAHRAFRLNPHFEYDAARLSKGVVLIDEVDLHLHPKWQRRVVKDLQKAFPNLQFIVTTHSPFILQSAQNDEVIDVSRDRDRKYIDDLNTDLIGPSPEDSVENKSIEDIAESVMGIEVPQRSARFQEMYEAAQKYYLLLKNETAESREEKDALKRRLDELSSPFSENVAYHAFLEMKRIGAGVTSPDEEE
jgi:predicted ATP-binding protein involved in virulence